MAVYACLGFLVLGLMTLVWGKSPDRRGEAFVAGVTFVALAMIVMIASAIHSLWLYPLS